MSRTARVDRARCVIDVTETIPSPGHIETSSILLYLRVVLGWPPRTARRALRDAVALGFMTHCPANPDRLEVEA